MSKFRWTPQSGEKLSREEQAELAAWEAQSPETARFEGGAPPNAVWISLAILCALVIGIYLLFVDPHRIRPGT